MCGIFGIAIFKHSKVRATVLRVILRSLALKNEIRGTNSTGYAFTSNKEIKIFKSPARASEFVKLENYRKTLRDFVKAEFGFPYSVLGHTRQQTKGSYLININNHPIKAGSIVGVHNGYISNDDEVFDWLEKKADFYRKRAGQVDSEAIFSLIDYLSKAARFDRKSAGFIGNRCTNPTTSAIINSAYKLVGSYAYAMVDSWNPKMLWIARNQGPVSIYYYKEEGLLIFSSLGKHIEEATAMTGFSEPEDINLDTMSVMSINIEECSYNIDKLGSKINQTG
jgi:glucosamine 6-phosphate synthetase-like amidotransferase/phosphosugar isomerase protein